MRKFWSVTGQLVEVHRYINVPMRWCEQHPAREKRELWVSAVRTAVGGGTLYLAMQNTSADRPFPRHPEGP
jgi:hypothetical protein